MKRVTLRTNMDYRDDKVTFALSSNLGYTRRNFQTGQTTQFNGVVNPFFVPLTTPRYITPTLPNGKYNVAAGIVNAGPVYLDKTQYDKVYNDQIKTVIGMNVDYNFTKNIYGGAVTGIDYRHTQNVSYNDPRTFDTRISASVRTHSGSYSEGTNEFFQADAKAYLGYRN